MTGAVLVTGGAGYVGSHAVKALADAGRDVVVLDDLSALRGERTRPEFLRRCEFVLGDAGDRALVSRLCREHRVTAVMHFAGRISVEESVRDPAGYRHSNVEVTARLAEAARAAGVAAFVFSSSAAVYGAPEHVPIPETHPLRPENPYGASKKEAEEVLVRSCASVACLRYFNAAGADAAAGLGERHDPETHLIPLALSAARAGRPVTVFGRDYDVTPDGTCVRDYVHVCDLADAHVAALDLLERGLPGGAWNLGAGRGHSVLEVIEAVARATGREVEVEFGPRRPGDAPILVADVSKARRDLGWNPTRSTLPRMVEDAWEFAARMSK